MAFNIKPVTTQTRAPFNGHLNPNEVFGSIYNMILFQEVMYPELYDNFGFVEMFRTEGGLFGDTALYYDLDVLKSRSWLGDNEAQNLLQIERPYDPECQAVVVDQFRIIKTSLDNYLTKRAWSTEGVFGTFQSIVRGMISRTKKLYDVTLVNSRLGSAISGAARGTISVPLSGITATGEEKNRLRAQTIAQHVADLLVDMKDYSRDFNDYGFMRAYSEEDLHIVWNTSFVNEITKLDLPTIFNNKGLVDKFEQHVLPARYFSEPTTTTNVKAASGLTLVGEDVTIGESYSSADIITYVEGDFVDSSKDNALVHKFIGEKLPKGATFKVGEAGFVDADVICKIITKDTFKYLAGFETGTEFFNPQSLNSSQMLIWGYSEPTRLLGQPCVTVHAD